MSKLGLKLYEQRLRAGVRQLRLTPAQDARGGRARRSWDAAGHDLQHHFSLKHHFSLEHHFSG